MGHLIHSLCGFLRLIWSDYESRLSVKLVFVKYIYISKPEMWGPGQASQPIECICVCVLSILKSGQSMELYLWCNFRRKLKQNEFSFQHFEYVPKWHWHEVELNAGLMWAMRIETGNCQKLKPYVAMWHVAKLCKSINR